MLLFSPLSLGPPVYFSDPLIFLTQFLCIIVLNPYTSLSPLSPAAHTDQFAKLIFYHRKYNLLWFYQYLSQAYVWEYAASLLLLYTLLQSILKTPYLVPNFLRVCFLRVIDTVQTLSFSTAFL